MYKQCLDAFGPFLSGISFRSPNLEYLINKISLCHVWTYMHVSGDVFGKLLPLCSEF